MEYLYARTKAWTLTLIWGVAVLGSAGALWWLSSPHRWPSTEGLVVESAYYGHGTAFDNFYKPSVAGPYVAYQYMVEGQHHRSDRISLFEQPSERDLDDSLWARQAQAMVDDHPVGSKIEVRYDPSRPSRAVVSWDLNRPATVGAGLLLSLLTVATAYEWKHAWRVAKLAKHEAPTGFRRRKAA